MPFKPSTRKHTDELAINIKVRPDKQAESNLLTWQLTCNGTLFHYGFDEGDAIQALTKMVTEAAEDMREIAKRDKHNMETQRRIKDCREKERREQDNLYITDAVETDE